jgi:DNA-directed RNA polymerase specialized sigma24 family protein
VEVSPTDGTLAQRSFDRLLAALDPDRDRAAYQYERIRARLTKFFEWNRCLRAEEYADRAMDRVARRVAEGAELRSSDPYSYFHGVALNLLKEYWREPVTRWTSIEGIEPLVPPADAHETALHDEKASREVRLDCLETCLAELPAESRRLLAAYHGTEKRRIDARRAMAEALGLPANALRIRMFRLRTALEACITSCTAARTK